MSRIGIVAAVLFAALYAVSLIHLDRLGVFPLEEALTILVVLGIVFPFVAWVVTIGVRAQALSVKSPMGEALLAVALVAAVGGYLVFWRSAADALVPGAAQGGSDLAHMAWVLALKLTVFVAIPFLLFRTLFRTRWEDFGLSAASFRRLIGRDGLTVLVLGAAICAFQFYVGAAAAPFREGKYAMDVLQAGLPLAFVWLVFEVGMTEEFLFRAVLQERLSAALKSDVAGLCVMALLFGLVHAPGIVLRGAGVDEGLGAHPDIWTAAAYVIAVQAVAALVFGILWLRTRNLLVVVLFHAATDLLSNASELFGAFGLAD
jgi:membrane protease YdiL (CAAX protease family)